MSALHGATTRIIIRFSTLLALSFLTALPLAAQGVRVARANSPFARADVFGNYGQQGWFGLTSLSFVLTDGNSDSATLGFRTQTGFGWDNSWITIRGFAFRAESTVTQRLAVGTPDDFEILERSQTNITAERYDAAVQYHRKYSRRGFWLVGGGWDRNEFSGIANRYYLSGGIGHRWVNTDTTWFRSEFGLTYTDREFVNERPNRVDTFPGLRVTTYFSTNLSGSARLINQLILDQNLEDTSDFRGDMINELRLGITDRWIVFGRWRLTYDNDRFRTLKLRDPETGEPTGDRVPVEVGSIDNIFNVGILLRY